MPVLPGTPYADGFAMPAEWTPHERCWMLWPERPDNWRLSAKPAQAAFGEVAAAISRFEPVTVLASARQSAQARSVLPARVRVLEAPADDAWMRDVGPSFVTDAAGRVRAVDWRFNAWGGSEHGLYAPWDQDDQLAGKTAAFAGVARYRAPFVLEGGAFHVDGEGTALVTEACLLDPARNPAVTKPRMAAWLRDYLGVHTVLWLGAGVPEDETGGHIDNLACFAAPGVVLLSWCDDAADPHYAVCRDAAARLADRRDHAGRRLVVERLPMPRPMAITAEEAAGIAAGDGRLRRAAGQRLAASYVNFYIANGAVIAPAFGGPGDEAARVVLARLFAGRQIVMLPGREILLGGGNIHCITQQQPLSGPDRRRPSAGGG